MSDKPAETEHAAKPKGGKSMMLIIIVAVLLLGGGGGGYFWYAKRAAAAAMAAAEEEEADKADAKDTAGEHGERAAKKKKKKKKGAEEDRLMSFEPFVVNLADQGSARFLRTNVQLVVSGGKKEAGGEGEGKKGPSVEQMRARSAILEILSAQTSDKLTTPEGKEELKKRIIERMTDILEKSEIDVEDVLFSDFVIQF
jgi:flagellar FliL protein